MRTFTVEIPITFVLPVEAESLDDAWRLVGRMTIADAIEGHRWYAVGAALRVLDQAPPPLPEQADDAVEGGE